MTIDNGKETSILCDFCNSWIHPSSIATLERMNPMWENIQMTIVY